MPLPKAEGLWRVGSEAPLGRGISGRELALEAETTACSARSPFSSVLGSFIVMQVDRHSDVELK